MGWFEIPVSDMDRAVAFYNSVLGLELVVVDLGPIRMAVMPTNRNAYGAGGALVQNENYTPQTDGLLAYFQCPDVKQALNRANASGGKILLEKRHVSDDFGFMGLALDSEGNRIAFQSHK